ncbi:MAG: NUDIX hydrolase, partial [Trebonia sp.]
VRVVTAPGSGDDAIVAEVASLAADSASASCLVVTADRELRRRCAALGASVAGPGWLIELL